MNPGSTILILILADLGTDHRCRKLAGSLRDLGYRPRILCDRPMSALGPSWEGFEVSILTRRSHFLGFIPAFLEYLVRVTPILLRDRSAAWIVADGTPLFWAALFGRLRGKRVIYDAREILLDTPAIRDRPSRRLAWKLWLGAGEALCGPLLTVSPGFLRHYRGAHPGRAVHLLPNAPVLAPAVALRAAPSGTVRLIYQGALRPGSGLGNILPALARAPEYELDIYGRGPEDAALRSLAAGLGLGWRVRFHGSVPFEDLAAPMAAAHIGLHPIAPICRSFDLTLSNKVFDYVHALLPMLLGPTAAHREFLAQEPVGMIPASDSPEDVLAALAEIRARYTSLAIACREARTRWHWDAYAQGLEQALRE